MSKQYWELGVECKKCIYQGVGAREQPCEYCGCKIWAAPKFNKPLKYKIGAALLGGGYLFNFFETWYFGWNNAPICVAEMICDYVSGALIISGAIMMGYVIVSRREFR